MYGKETAGCPFGTRCIASGVYAMTLDGKEYDDPALLQSKSGRFLVVHGPATPAPTVRALVRRAVQRVFARLC